MDDEYIDILNGDLTVLKKCLKSKAHKYGYLHASVHVWFYTDDGKILLQKRSANKIAFPGLWDVSVAGHIVTEENKVTSALREIKEEIGLSISEKQLDYIGLFKEKHDHKIDFIDNEIHFTFISNLKKSLNQLKILKEELSAIKLIKIESFSKIINTSSFKNKYVPHKKEYYHFVLNEILKRL